MKKYEDKKVYYHTYNTLFGEMFFASIDEGLCMVSFMDGNIEKQFRWLKKYFREDNIIKKNTEKNIKAYRQLEEYFSGKRKDFDLNIHLLGTTFQKQVWNILGNIKFGKVWTYKAVAEELGDTNKCRAVGGAIGKNPISVIIPCHRVIGSNGKLTGFSAPDGILLKKRLLDLEKKHNL
ncbi:methylated-DNA--[protein]-cysteine S-methyltransferase [Paramaledivibacter caminithermalis]|jgi:O-6-methylguanine DNA methyltransferase|uniref:methylated-DNA--[protein]-cysteine S-methyltransferase n=1 Tax=Paramaledivibacter caminithermalis (strain DSM 15212 / CIP 107654 / DViRD3) TaxID=1121301 RepID=A0A1M6PA63_PARC5|nr:methylated-DNA--[protein]-cysteine S-methyltransferase [Paramaledivibacter caminithermalis]SHK04762.1 methylated-DNA-[protein]-cysteine S-methyltransferase [Paramaledivibacter caminithermalis DSM 15212]